MSRTIQASEPVIPLPVGGFDLSRVDESFGIGLMPSADEENPYLIPEDIIEKNRQTLQAWIERWLMGTSLVGPLILDDFQVDRTTGEAKADRNVSQATCRASSATSAIIVATGPSLEKYLDSLKSWKGLIIAAPTALSTLVAHGIIPHYCVAVDASDSIGLILSEAPYASMGIQLLIPPTIDYRTAKAFDGARWWFKSLLLAKNGPDHPFNLYMTLLYPWILNWVYQAGCVTNAAFLLAMMLNAEGRHNIEKVFLFGADFGYPEGLSRVKSYKYAIALDGSPRWLEQPRDPLTFRVPNMPIVRSANGIPSDPAMLGYKRSLYTCWLLQGTSPMETPLGLRRRPCLYSCSEGILFEMPIADGHEVIESQGESISLYDGSLIKEVFRRYVLTTGKAEGQIRGDITEEDFRRADEQAAVAQAQALNAEAEK
jgi:hypothetical protein